MPHKIVTITLKLRVSENVHPEDWDWAALVETEPEEFQGIVNVESVPVYRTDEGEEP